MLAALARYAEFSGRGSRTEYWLFVLLVCIVFPITVIVDALSFPNGAIDEYGQVIPLFLITGIASVALLIPCYSALVRRLHDTNRSGWWMFLSLVPLVGPILLLVWTCQPGDPRRNRFGAPPRETPGRFEDGGQQIYDSRHSSPSPPLPAQSREKDIFEYDTRASPFAKVPANVDPKRSDDAWMDRLEQMAKLRDQGILTEEEFATEKAALLAGLIQS